MFTDDDLKQLKEDLLDVSKVDLVHFLQDIEALLARLEAAEHFLDAIDTHSTVHWDSTWGTRSLKLLEAWRKAAGK